jgi:hypothetical protein
VTRSAGGNPDVVEMWKAAGAIASLLGFLVVYLQTWAAFQRTDDVSEQAQLLTEFITAGVEERLPNFVMLFTDPQGLLVGLAVTAPVALALYARSQNSGGRGGL